MAYIASENITVFPNARRAAADPENQLKARKMTEENTVGILKHASDYDSYVISNAYSSEEGSIFEFVIGGYYFLLNEVNIPAMADTWESGYYAYATISTSSVNGYTELVGQDDSGDYTGLIINFGNSDQLPANSSNQLVLLVYDENAQNSANIPQSSRKKFTPDRLDFSQIAYIGGITVS